MMHSNILCVCFCLQLRTKFHKQQEEIRRLNELLGQRDVRIKQLELEIKNIKNSQPHQNSLWDSRVSRASPPGRTNPRPQTTTPVLKGADSPLNLLMIPPVAAHGWFKAWASVLLSVRLLPTGCTYSQFTYLITTAESRPAVTWFKTICTHWPFFCTLQSYASSLSFLAFYALCSWR